MKDIIKQQRRGWNLLSRTVVACLALPSQPCQGAGLQTQETWAVKRAQNLAGGCSHLALLFYILHAASHPFLKINTAFLNPGSWATGSSFGAGRIQQNHLLRFHPPLCKLTKQLGLHKPPGCAIANTDSSISTMRSWKISQNHFSSLLADNSLKMGKVCKIQVNNTTDL